MSDTEDTVRLTVEIPRVLNEKLKTFLPWGTKTEVLRALVDLFVTTQCANPQYLAQDLIQGRCRITVIQNLKNSGTPE